MSDQRCRHGRIGACPYCAARIRADHYWEMVRWQVELRRKGRRRTPRVIADDTPESREVG